MRPRGPQGLIKRSTLKSGSAFLPSASQGRATPPTRSYGARAGPFGAKESDYDAVLQGVVQSETYLILSLTC